ncbi:uncharacterized protein Dana_GF26323 [Drosophila ananassae]|uniref:Uncharacterized protein n=1 Tax=Drosophila ananassae TaxID=7217 RepID=A0A0P8Y1M5_DROAN|nr:uncharacterized protein LOC26513732 [Drosophila ananassae]KPU75703.1 uncharacterized protein Dana_GF26323 [Drosophila ananassae]
MKWSEIYKLFMLFLLLGVEISQEQPTALAKRRLPRDEPGPDAKGDLKLLHAPCEFDLIKYATIDYFPSHCQPVYQNRHVSEDWYRLYRTYDTEGFVFGQFYERLMRHEVD